MFRACLARVSSSLSLRTTLRINEHKIHDIIVSIFWYKMIRDSFYLLKVLYIFKIKEFRIGVFKVSEYLFLTLPEKLIWTNNYIQFPN